MDIFDMFGNGNPIEQLDKLCEHAHQIVERQKKINAMQKINVSGTSVSICNGIVTINGQRVDLDKNENQFTIIVEGNVETMNIDSCITATVNGSVGSVKTMSGNVRCGNVNGNVSTMSGDVEAREINGKVSTMSGDIR